MVPGGAGGCAGSSWSGRIPRHTRTSAVYQTDVSAKLRPWSAQKYYNLAETSRPRSRSRDSHGSKGVEV
eukprot:1158261-Pelagomonas_calceolata.AAC.3